MTFGASFIVNYLLKLSDESTIQNDANQEVVTLVEEDVRPADLPRRVSFPSFVALLIEFDIGYQFSLISKDTHSIFIHRSSVSRGRVNIRLGPQKNSQYPTKLDSDKACRLFVLRP